ncbi:DMT family transporter [Profundibacter sp.]|uniref:DMT family transporter n=1 Tax=Profundibacter sp. TaxID=3101071 RepID=UPI003D10B7F1
MHNDRPLLGILLMATFCVMAPFADAMAKVLGGTVPVVQIVTFRFTFQVLILLPIVLLTKRDLRMDPRTLGLLFLRSILHIIGIGAMFLSLIYLPLAEAVAIAFVEPFLLLLLAWLILKEHIGPHRLIACAIGFVGTLLVIQPSFANVGYAALLPLIVAVAFAAFMIVTRQLTAKSDPVTLQAISGGMALLVLALVLWATSGYNISALTLITPSDPDLVLLAILGILGTLAHLVMTWSLKFAPTATLAPVQYLEIPFATLIGWLIFKDFPNGLAAIGILITVAAGLYIVMRERRLAIDSIA